MKPAPRLRPPRDRFSPLVAALFTILLAYPYVPDGELGAMLGGLLSMSVVLSGVWALRGHRYISPIGASLAGLALVFQGIDVVAPAWLPPWFTEAQYALFYLLITVMVIREVLASARLTVGTVAGAISGYLLVGLVFAQIYDLIETLHPGSFAVAHPVQDHVGWRTLVFFSFMTLTTVGYGDITPVRAQVQSLAMVEACIGVLYVTVFIAGMVSLSLSRRPD